MDAKTIHRLYRAIEEFRKFDEEMPLQTALTFLFVCLHDGTSQKAISDDLGVSQATVSRNVATLSDWHRLHKPGHDLVVAKEDINDRRAKLIYLTAKGRRVADTLATILKP